MMKVNVVHRHHIAIGVIVFLIIFAATVISYKKYVEPLRVRHSAEQQTVSDK